MLYDITFVIQRTQYVLYMYASQFKAYIILFEIYLYSTENVFIIFKYNICV